jgi:hypothetical protein
MKKYIILGVIGLVLLGLCFTSAPYQLLTSRTIENVLVKEKQVSTESNKETKLVVSTYLIFTDEGVFRNDDAFWHFKYNSSDLYGLLDNGKRYNLKVYGWRIPILTMYPNIVKATEIKEGEKK